MRIIKTSLSVLIALTACTLEKPYTEPQQKFQAEFEAPAARTYVDGSGDQMSWIRPRMAQDQPVWRSYVEKEAAKFYKKEKPEQED